MLNRSTVDKFILLFTPLNKGSATAIVQFLLALAKTDRSIEDAMSDAVLLNILPFLKVRWNALRIYSDVYRRVRFGLGRKYRSPYRAYTLDLLHEVRSSESGLHTVVDQGNSSGSWVYFLQPLFNPKS
jgi:hypothetical protein